MLPFNGVGGKEGAGDSDDGGAGAGGGVASGRRGGDAWGRRQRFEQRRLGKTLGERTTGERKARYFTSELGTTIYDAEIKSHVDNMSRRTGQRGSHLSAKIHGAEPC